MGVTGCLSDAITRNDGSLADSAEGRTNKDSTKKI